MNPLYDTNAPYNLLKAIQGYLRGNPLGSESCTMWIVGKSNNKEVQNEVTASCDIQPTTAHKDCFYLNL